MKFLLITAALIIAGMLAFKTCLQNGSFIQYLDTHPDPKIVPPVEYAVGEGYYLFRHLQNSATYYQRISERYPTSSYAEDAYFNYLQSLDDMSTPRLQMAELYATYLEKFPEGKYKEIVTKRIEYCRNSR